MIQVALIEKPSRKKEQCTLSTYLALRKNENKPVFDDASAVPTYCEKIGLPHEYALLAWREFKMQHTIGLRQNKRQKDWPATFLNALKMNWYNLWRMNRDGEYYLTTQGKQAQLEQQGAKQ